MKLHVLSKIRDFKIENSCQIAVTEFSNNREFRFNFFYKNEAFVKCVGSSNLTNGNDDDFAFHYITFDENDFKDITSKEEITRLARRAVNMCYDAIIDQLFFLWFVKDNSISLDFISGIIDEKEIIVVTKCLILYTNRFGEFEAEKFSEYELKKALEIQQKYNSIFQPKRESFKDIVNKIDTNYNTTSYNEHNRIQRSIKFLQALRATVFLPQKISLYIPIFECLFSIDATEISHKVSERIAYYLGSNKEERLEIFKTTKECYDLRSKFFHGSDLGKSHNTFESQKILAEKVDEICRKILLKVIHEDSSIFLDTKPNLQFFFDSLLFN